tara:strand:- start:15 stop:383 length:369 start_codon:yes stop_codon:yes gene_type:complete
MSEERPPFSGRTVQLRKVSDDARLRRGLVALRFHDIGISPFFKTKGLLGMRLLVPSTCFMKAFPVKNCAIEPSRTERQDAASPWSGLNRVREGDVDLAGGEFKGLGPMRRAAGGHRFQIIQT